MSVRPAFAVLVALVVVTGCSGSSPTGAAVPTPSPAPVPTSPPASTSGAAGEAATVMSALCHVQEQPSANAEANAAFFSVHDTLHELADRLNLQDERTLSAQLLQATAAVEAHVEGTTTSVPWPQATAALVEVVPRAYATLNVTAPACR